MQDIVHQLFICLNQKRFLQTSSQSINYTITKSISIVLWLILYLLINPAFAEQHRHAITPDLRILLQRAIESTDSFTDRFEAEVWLADMSTRLKQRVEDDKERLTILKNVHYEATRAELAPELILAVIEIESGFDRFAISKVGARGLMQIMPFWLVELNQANANLFSIPTNLRFGCTILKHYLEKENGDLRRAFARYNGSLGKRRYPDKVFSALSERWYKN